MSFAPWMIKVGALTFSIVERLSNRSRTSIEATDPSNERVAAFKLVYGEIRIKAEMFWYCEAIWQAGPLPIDLPTKMMSY